MNLYALASKLLSLVASGLTTLKAIAQEQIAQRAILEKILAAVVPGPIAEIRFTVSLDGQITEGATHVQLKDTEQFDFTLSPVDAKGSPSSIDPTKTTATTDDPTVAAVTLNLDGLSGTVVAGKSGSTQLKVSVTDANNASDTVSGTLSITVVSGDTATLAIGTSAPTPQVPLPPPPPPQP